MNRKKMILLALLLTLSLSGCNESKDKEIIPYSKYSKGNIYIGNSDYLKSLNINENDILILDKRDSHDPDIKVYDSYLIVDSDVIDEILDIIINYEKEFPSEWSRTKETMKIEWLVHNIAYYLNFQRERTKDVDFNNLDEVYYKNNDLLPLILAKK